jgi:hypothetical protein
MAMKKTGRIVILTVMAVVFLLAVGWLTFCYTEVGMADGIGFGEPGFSGDKSLDIPQSVVEDATRLAIESVGDNQAKLQDFVNQLLAAYVAARDTDVVVVFNSGGWGWNRLDETPGWATILDGIRASLDGLGYRSLVLNYQRTSRGLRGGIKEFIEEMTRYPTKARELADRVTFLIDSLPDLRVIVAGESTGTVITDKAMALLKDKPQVYSIQTGTPFWHKPTPLNRTLLMNSNGKTIDTFSYGNVPAMVWATVKGWLGLSSPEDNPGNILNWLRAPGHDYSWQYPGVCSGIAEFLKENFGTRG